MRNARAMRQREAQPDSFENGGKKKRSIFKSLLLLCAVALVGFAIAIVKSSHGAQIAYDFSTTELMTWAGIYLAVNEHYA